MADRNDLFNGHENYEEAKKLAIKSYNKGLAQRGNGYLPSLDSIIRSCDIVSEYNLGVIEIPLKKVVGTYQALRSNSFAENFMPLADMYSEFGDKWSRLSAIHMTEGIRDPIKVYEYLGRFYVVEGNKRVSVLKYFGAYSISAKVLRLIPKKDPTDITNNIYYEFMNFNHKTGIWSIWFSKDGRFNKLLEYIESFTPPKSKFQIENKYKYIENYVYFTFRKIYLEVGGGDLPITTGDAFLEYVKLYGIPGEISEIELKNFLKKFILEVEALSKHESVDVQTTPKSPSAQGVFSTLTTFIKPKKKYKIAFLYNNSIQNSDWIYSHELGRQHIQNLFGDQIETAYFENVPENDDAMPFIVDLIQKGFDMIFTTSPGFITVTLKAALEYTNVKFFNCSATHFLKHVSTYWGRLYEPKFLTGLIAGALTKTNTIGYIDSHPIPDIISSLNAFALGARFVNPNAKIKIKWSGEWNGGVKAQQSAKDLIDDGVDIIFANYNLVPNKASRDLGISSSLCAVNKENKTLQYLASPIWYWGLFYENIISNILNGTWKNVMDIFSSNSKIINFWWGMNSGVVDIDFNSNLIPIDTQKLIRFMREMIISENFNPFTGPIYDQNNELKIPSSDGATNDQILNMDWLSQGTEGDLPIIDI